MIEVFSKCKMSKRAREDKLIHWLKSFPKVRHVREDGKGRMIGWLKSEGKLRVVRESEKWGILVIDVPRLATFKLLGKFSILSDVFPVW